MRSSVTSAESPVTGPAHAGTIRRPGDPVPPGGAGGGRRARLRTPSPVAVLVAALALLAAPGTTVAQPHSADPLPAGAEERVARHHGYPAVPVSALSGRLSGTEEAGGRLRARLDGAELSLVAGSPFYRHGDRIRQLPNPPYLEAGEVWIPVRLFRRAVAGEGDGGPAAGSARRPVPGEATEAGSVTPPGGDASAAGEERTGPWRVVLDPGHGGRDPGARGPRGTREKGIVLEMARRIRDRLNERPGIEASLTRTGDEFIPLAQRSRIAIRRDADLFVSLHANSARNRSARGFETYFLGEARTDESRRVALRENASVKYQEDTDWSPERQVEYILTSADQRAYVHESNFVAGHIQNRLRRRHSGPDRGVKQAGFYVLMGASGSMPAVLVETGFLSNPAGERLLRGDDGQARIAGSVADAIASYFRERERRGSVRTARR